MKAKRKKKQLKVKAAKGATKKPKGNCSKKSGKVKSAKKRNVKVKSLEDRLYWKLAGVGMIAFALFSAVALTTFNWECVSSL